MKNKLSSPFELNKADVLSVSPSSEHLKKLRKWSVYMVTEMQIDERPLVKTNNDQINESHSLIPLEAKIPSLKISFYSFLLRESLEPLWRLMFLIFNFWFLSVFSLWLFLADNQHYYKAPLDRGEKPHYINFHIIIIILLLMSLI